MTVSKEYLMSHSETSTARLAQLQAQPLAERFALQQGAARGDPNPQRAVRERRLAALDQMLRDNAVAIGEAVSRDFGHRSPAETRLLELFPSYEAIRHARRHLRRWMRPQRRSVSLWFQPGRAEVRYQPLGAVGIIVPWNYPIFLAIAPLAAALAAGNRALVKMSEMSPHTAALFATLVAQDFFCGRVVGGRRRRQRRAGVFATAFRSSAIYRFDCRWPPCHARGGRSSDAGDA
jgi:coniferyl-aldehyde dehydrogenase